MEKQRKIEPESLDLVALANECPKRVRRVESSPGLRCESGRRSSRNMVVHGENLSTLAALRAGFGLSGRAVQVDIIYIDPPYNVGGNQGYKNTWKGRSEKERDWAGNHGEFLDFMEPRLKIGRQLLNETGMIFVSICDGEFCRLKILMDEIFGETNHIASLIWDKGRGAAGSHATVSHEYVLCYAKNKAQLPQLSSVKPSAQSMIEVASQLVSTLPYAKAQAAFKKWVNAEKKAGRLKPGEAAYSSIHPENHRLFHADNSCAQDDPNGRRCRKALIHPRTQKACPVPKNGWKWSENTLDELVRKGLIWFGDDHTVVPKIIRYLDEYTEQQPLSVFYDGGDGKKDLPSGISFTTPKPVSMVQYLISLYPKKNAVVLDYFAGSGATAHAVHRLNSVDSGTRSWILIEEMGSTFENVLLPRLTKTAGDFAVYKTENVSVGSKEIASFFTAYSRDFLSAYHNYDEKEVILAEGLSEPVKST